MAARGRVVRGQDEVDRVAVQVLAVDARGPRVRLVLPLVGQDEIDVAERERRQRLLGLGLDQLAAQAGRLARERLHRRDGEVERDRLERGDPRPPGDAARGRRQLGLGELGALEQRLGVARRARARRRSAARRGRPRSSSGTPASRSSTASCWETADGVNCSASATAAIVPRACSSCSRRSRRRSSIRKQRY